MPTAVMRSHAQGIPATTFNTLWWVTPSTWPRLDQDSRMRRTSRTSIYNQFQVQQYFTHSKGKRKVPWMGYHLCLPSQSLNVLFCPNAVATAAEATKLQKSNDLNANFSFRTNFLGDTRRDWRVYSTLLQEVGVKGHRKNEWPKRFVLFQAALCAVSGSRHSRLSLSLTLAETCVCNVFLQTPMIYSCPFFVLDFQWCFYNNNALLFPNQI